MKIFLAFLPLVLSSTAAAQSFNVDIGATAGTNPLPAYGAAAGQPGFWNWLNATPAAMGVFQGLSPLAGGAPTAAVRFVAGDDGNFNANHPFTFGDDERLMDDVHDVRIGDPAIYEFHGLAAGGYWLYTYAMAPDDPDYRTKIEVLAPVSVDPSQVVGGDWLPGHEYARTYAKHFVVVPAGAVLIVKAEVSNLFGSVNGFQLVFGGAGTCDGEIDIYCDAKPNSAGCTPSIGWAAGPPSVGACGCPFFITASNVLSNKAGYLFYGLTGPLSTPFLGGTMCVAPPRYRCPQQNSGGAGACGGHYTFDFNARIPSHNAVPGIETIVPGDSVWAQWYYRDPAHVDGTGTGLTDAIHFSVCF